MGSIDITSSATARTSANMESEEEFYDTIIVGGGAAGIGAAIGARQAAPDSRILLVESEGSLGGAGTHRGVNSYAGLYSCEPRPRQAVGKIWNDLHARLVAEDAASALPDKLIVLVQVSTPAVRDV